ncbi:MAG: hypothetical protein WD801_09805 [Gemmatimonadaceae bacterium]
MNDYLKLHSDGGDDETARGLRELYAPPADGAYWRGLEARILSRLTESAGTTVWWDELDRWMRPALLAAAVALMAVGIALFRARQMEHDVAYEAMLTPTTLPIETAVRPMLQGQREATFRYLMTSR